MCYKQELQKNITINVFKKLEKYPEFVKKYFNRLKSAKTKNTNFGYIEKLFNWLLENKIITHISPKELNKVTCDNIINYLDTLKFGIGCTQNCLSTIETKKNVFSAFWEYLQDKELVNKNIIKKIPYDLYKSEKSNIETCIKIPTNEELDTFLTNITAMNSDKNGCMLTAIVDLFMGSGIRSEELIGLDLNDLFLNEEMPYIMVLGKGKLEKKDKVLISYKAKESLIKYLLTVRSKIKTKSITEKAVFISNRRTRYSKGALDNMFNRYSKNKITPHMLRHWYGTMLYNKTHNIRLVQNQLRHESVEVAAKYYVHTSEDDLFNAVWNI